ncbi:MAG: LysR family transcriptional regulator [Halopseudomonas aestusnigri]
MNLKLLMDVLALIEERSFTKAAQRRNVTQSAFSRRIQSMEDWLGYKCVDRSGNTITVTVAALGTEERIRSLINQMNELKGYMASEDQHNKRVIFTAPHTLSVFLFARLIEYLYAVGAKQKPPVGYSYRLKSEYKKDCLATFLRGDADFFICNEEKGSTSIPESFQCRSTVLGSDQLIPVVSPKWQGDLNNKAMGTNPLPLITYPETSYLWMMLNKECLPALQEKHRTEVVCETGLSASVKEMVLQGLGLGWLPRSFVAQELLDGDLINLQENFGHCDLDLMLYMAQSTTSISSESGSGLGNVFDQIDAMNTFERETLWGIS